MNLAEVNAYIKTRAIGENGLVSRISKVLKDCEYCQSFMIAIYLVEQDHFLYCNQKLRQIVGESNNKLLEGGWGYWFSLVDAEERVWIKDRLVNFFATPVVSEPLSLRYHITNIKGRRICLKHEIILHPMERHTLAVNYWIDITDKERIELHFSRNKDSSNHRFSKKRAQNITTREREVLRLIADGFSSKEIADKLFISNHTAISHRKNLIEKFQVKNTAHLIKKAFSIIRV